MLVSKTCGIIKMINTSNFDLMFTLFEVWNQSLTSIQYSGHFILFLLIPLTLCFVNSVLSWFCFGSFSSDSSADSSFSDLYFGPKLSFLFLFTPSL